MADITWTTHGEFEGTAAGIKSAMDLLTLTASGQIIVVPNAVSGKVFIYSYVQA